MLTAALASRVLRVPSAAAAAAAGGRVASANGSVFSNNTALRTGTVSTPVLLSQLGTVPSRVRQAKRPFFPFRFVARPRFFLAVAAWLFGRVLRCLRNAHSRVYVVDSFLLRGLHFTRV